MFTGPDGVGDYRPKLYSDSTFVGIGPKGSEATNDISYLFGPDFVDKPRRKHERLGEIGCDIRSFIEQLSGTDRESRSHSSVAEEQTNNPMHPIVHGPFRTAVENNAVLHRYQEPWYPDSYNRQLHLGWPANATRMQSRQGGRHSAQAVATGSRAGSRAGAGGATASQSGLIRGSDTDSNK